MSEEVRVCDTCYGKLTNPQSQPQSPAVASPSNKEDEDLAKAIAASLSVSGGSSKPAKSTVRFQDPALVESEEDKQLKMAIEASLRESTSKKSAAPASTRSAYDNLRPSYSAEPRSSYNSDTYSRPSYQQDAPTGQSAYQQAPTQQEVIASPHRPAHNPNLVSDIELKNIVQFSALVERTQADTLNRGIQSMNPHQLQMLFQQVLQLSPKLMNSLADSAGKYKSLYDLNSEITKLVEAYDVLIRNRSIYGGQQQGYAPNPYAQPGVGASGAYSHPSAALGSYAPHAGNAYVPAAADQTNYGAPGASGSEYAPANASVPQGYPSAAPQMAGSYNFNPDASYAAQPYPYPQTSTQRNNF
jgi:Ubiquitin interaction motif